MSILKLFEIECFKVIALMKINRPSPSPHDAFIQALYFPLLLRTSPPVILKLYLTTLQLVSSYVVLTGAHGMSFQSPVKITQVN